VAWLLEAALRWLADHTPATAELLRLLDGTPGVRPLADHRMRSELAGWAGYGHDTSHHCFYWGSRLLLVRTADGTVTGFGWPTPNWSANARRWWACSKLSRPIGGHPARCWLATRALPAATSRPPGLDLALVRPARTDEPDPGVFPNWLRQRIEAII
jgi:hypothetical protein